MYDHTQRNMEEIKEAVKPFVEILQQKLSLNEEDAYLLHFEMIMRCFVAGYVEEQR